MGDANRKAWRLPRSAARQNRTFVDCLSSAARRSGDRGHQNRKSGPIKAIHIKAIPGRCLHSERRPKSGGDASGVSTPVGTSTSVQILSATPEPLVQSDRNTRTI